MPEDISAELLVLATENADLRLQLADLQDCLIEAAVDAGELHEEVQNLRLQLRALEQERDAWRFEVDRLGGHAAA